MQVARAELPWRLVALCWGTDDQMLAMRTQLRTHFDDFAFAVCVPFGRDRAGVLFRAAAAEPADPALVARVAACFGLEDPQALHYVDARRGQRRSMRLARDGDEQRLEAFLLAGDTRAEAWIAPLLQQQLPAQAYGRSLLAAGPLPPGPALQRDRQVCSCFDVGETRIHRALAAMEGPPAERLAAL